MSFLHIEIDWSKTVSKGKIVNSLNDFWGKVTDNLMCIIVFPECVGYMKSLYFNLSFMKGNMFSCQSQNIFIYAYI